MKDKNFNCQTCTKEFTTEGGLFQHIKAKHDKNFVPKCRNCSLYFTCITKYVLHKREDLTDKPFVCSVCCERFTLEAQLEKHQEFHDKQRLYKCSICPRSFDRQKHLDAHEMKHNKPKYSCDSCQKMFFSSEKFKKHKCRSQK